jgi:hypothetical protein
LFLPQRTRLVFVRNVRDGRRCLHADAAFAMSALTLLTYDFDPTTGAKNSVKTRLQ